MDGKFTRTCKRRVFLLPNEESDRIAPNFFNEDAGIYLGVEGSRSDRMSKANDQLLEICDRIPESSIAKQIRMTNALRDTRVFKDIAGRKVTSSDRASATNKYLAEIGVKSRRHSPKPSASMSHLRVTRALVSCARGLAADDNKKEAQHVVRTIDKFMKAVSAPEKAVAEMKAVFKSIGI